jgi:hypothetical protein
LMSVNPFKDLFFNLFNPHGRLSLSTRIDDLVIMITLILRVTFLKYLLYNQMSNHLWGAWPVGVALIVLFM